MMNFILYFLFYLYILFFLLNVRKTDFNFSVIYTQKLKHTLLTMLVVIGDS